MSVQFIFLLVMIFLIGMWIVHLVKRDYVLHLLEKRLGTKQIDFILNIGDNTNEVTQSTSEYVTHALVSGYKFIQKIRNYSQQIRKEIAVKTPQTFTS